MYLRREINVLDIQYVKWKIIHGTNPVTHSQNQIHDIVKKKHLSSGIALPLI